MDDEEYPVVPVPDFCESAGSNDEEAADCNEAEDNVALLNTLQKQAFHDVEVQVHACVHTEERDEDASEQSMIRIQFFMAHSG